MIELKITIKKNIEKIVDKSNPKIVDKIAYGVMAALFFTTSYLFISTFEILGTGILDTHPKFIFSLLYLLAIGLFYFTLLGEVTNKPSNRPRIFFYITIIIAITTYSLLAEILNSSFTNFLETLINVTEVPQYLMVTNIRIVTVYIPIFIVVLVFHQALSILFKRTHKQELLEYTVDILTRNVDHISDYTVDLKICEDIETGEPVILTQKNAFKHTLVVGSSGSGKTALVLRPFLAEIFFKKAYFREELKKATYKALEKDLCYLKAPVSNKYINDNFSMDLIEVKEGKQEEFLKLFGELIVGVRSDNFMLYSNVTKEGVNVIPITLNNNVTKLKIIIEAYNNDMIVSECKIDYTKDAKQEPFNAEDFTVHLSLQSLEDIELSEEDSIKYTDALKINIIGHSDKTIDYIYKIVIHQEGKGKIIYRDLSCITVAPDGGLPEQTCNIAANNGIKVHKIDPKMSEIKKGGIAKFNPLLVGEPEKTGDIVSSILVSMESGNGKDTNPYYTNASIRAIRNIIIVLKVMHPIINNGENPNLEDVLKILNNFNLIRLYIEPMERDNTLKIRWRSVIDYFKTSFYPPPVDLQGKEIKGESEGSRRKKTEEAVAGIINQLDNFLGREEVKYILCDREESLNLADVLENGECIAVASRQSELGEILGRAFALFFILSLQNAVLCRYAEDENPEIPVYILIDEFPFYLNDNSKVFFTFARKYQCAVFAVIQNLAQLEEESDTFRQIVLSNTQTKLVLAGANVEDREYLSKMFGIAEEFEMQTGLSQNPILTENASYTESMRGTMTEKAVIKEQDLTELKFRRCFYTYTNPKGFSKVGKGYIDFVKLDTSNTIINDEYDFEIYNNNTSNKTVKNSLNNKNIARKLAKVDDDYDDYDDNYDNIADLENSIVDGFNEDMNEEMDVVSNTEDVDCSSIQEREVVEDHIYEIDRDLDVLENEELLIICNNTTKEKKEDTIQRENIIKKYEDIPPEECEVLMEDVKNIDSIEIIGSID